MLYQIPALIYTTLIHTCVANMYQLMLYKILCGNLFDIWFGLPCLTHKHLETDGGAMSTVATDVLVLKHQAISIHSGDLLFIAPLDIHTKMLYL